MVTQFRDNPYERHFYDLDKRVALSDYKRIYFIPELESKLAYCLNSRNSWRNQRDARLVQSLDLLRNEIKGELEIVGEENFPDVDKLNISRFDSAVYLSTAKFLTTLKQFYTNRMNAAAEE